VASIHDTAEAGVVSWHDNLDHRNPLLAQRLVTTNEQSAPSMTNTV